MAYGPPVCAACGFTGDVHEHHLVPQSQGGSSLPTVYLCVACHAAVHDRRWNVGHHALTLAGLARAKTKGAKFGNPGLHTRDREMIAKLVAARAAKRLRIILADVDSWLPTVQRMRPSYSWDEVSEALNKQSGNIAWTGERLRRTMQRLIKDGVVDAGHLLGATPRKDADNTLRLIPLVAKIANENPNYTLTQIAAHLEALHERTPRGGTRWHPSSVRHLLLRAFDPEVG